MTTILALPLLREAVVTLMDADAAKVPMVAPQQPFGWREPARRPEITAGATWRRIVWVPGDDGDVGEFGPAKQPGRNPKSLATLGELFTVYLEAQDPSDPEDELKQYTVCRLLLDAWFRAAFLHAGQQLSIESTEWVTDKTTRRFGGTIRVVCTIQAMIPDEPLLEAGGEGDAKLGAHGDYEMDDQAETDDIPPAPIPEARAASVGNLVLSGEQTVDGVALVSGDRVLVKNQTDATKNGLYVVFAGAWLRTADVLEHGVHIYVLPGGTLNGDAGFELTTADPIIIDTTSLTFERVSP